MDQWYYYLCRTRVTINTKQCSTMNLSAGPLRASLTRTCRTAHHACSAAKLWRQCTTSLWTDCSTGSSGTKTSPGSMPPPVARSPHRLVGRCKAEDSEGTAQSPCNLQAPYSPRPGCSGSTGTSAPLTTCAWTPTSFLGTSLMRVARGSSWVGSLST